MFTGIISHIGIIKQGLLAAKAGELIIQASLDFNNNIKIGDSIAVDGVCLTVIRLDNQMISFHVSDETVEKTSFPNRLVNLEKAMIIGDKLDGHLVQGHVDTTVMVDEVEYINNNKKIIFSLNNINLKYLKYIAPKGSIAINGVSLTVNTVLDNKFSVNIIPYTLQHTNLDYLKKNDLVNLEVDMFARYSINYIENYLGLLNDEEYKKR